MNKFLIPAVILLLSIVALPGCNDMLDVDSDRVIFTDDYDFTGANDSIYSITGVFSQMQKLADSYVLLGELRGDLLSVSDDAPLSVREIYNFDAAADNPYTSNKRDYYTVINNCNYIIANIDTALVKGAEQVMMPTYAQAKAIRAWTYMQLALNFGKAEYYEKPILTVEDTEAEYPEYSMEELAPILIADLAPVKNVTKRPSYSRSDMYFPVQFVLGDLYLWNGQYVEAASAYHDLMYYGKHIVSDEQRLTMYYTIQNGAFATFNVSNVWIDNVFSAGNTSGEFLTRILASNETVQHFVTDSLNLKGMLPPSAVAMNNWASQRYIENANLDTLVDLRIISAAKVVGQTLGYYLPSWSEEDYPNIPTIIWKYLYLSAEGETSTLRFVPVYRASLLYLRYAEAVNRAGKPNLAMAVIKNGLKQATLADTSIVPLRETGNVLPAYMDFTDSRFDHNAGVRTHGCGKVNLDKVHYIIGPRQDLNDSILYVEDLIEQELALETAFEGNRFHDLMRFALRRNDPAFLANKVAAKYGENAAAIRSKLSNRENWYLK